MSHPPEPASRQIGCAYCTRPARYEVTDSERDNKTLCCAPHLNRTVRFFHDVLASCALVDEVIR